MSGQVESAVAKITLNKLEGLLYPIPTALFDALNEADLAECLFQSLVEGNLPLFQALWERRGPVSLEYHEVDGNGFLNGRPFQVDPIDVLLQVSDSVGVKALFQTIHDLGIKGLIDAGVHYPSMFASRGIFSGMAVAHRIRYEGYLPFLEAGVLKDAELAVSLMEESKRSWAPEAYQPMLCWATEAMLTEFGEHLVPIRPLQRVDFVSPDLMDCGPNGGPVIFHEPLAEFKAANRDPETAVIKRIELGFEDSPAHTVFTNRLLNYFCNSSLRAGFLEEGRVLCETRADFLMQFPQTHCDDYHNSAAARIFAKDYFPLDIVGEQIASECVEQFGHNRESRYVNMGLSKDALATQHQGFLSSLYTQLNTATELRTNLLQMMTQEQWRALIAGCSSPTLWADTVIAFKDTLGMSNEGFQLVLLPEETYTFHEAGYRFIDGTKVFDDDEKFESFTKSHQSETCVYFHCSKDQVVNYLTREVDRDCPHAMILEEARNLHWMAQSMNLWTSPKPKPHDILSAMEEICTVDFKNPDDTHAMALSAYLMASGVDQCAKVAKTPVHWQRIVELFSLKETQPYLKQMPRSARGLVLEDSMGL
jgi:hypothetical protein